MMKDEFNHKDHKEHEGSTTAFVIFVSFVVRERVLFQGDSVNSSNGAQ